MAVIGVGLDLVEVGRVRALLERHPERFARRVFTEAEAAYCRRGARAAERFAARYAAKEAIMKALGTGWSAGVAFRDIEVIRAASGAPGIRLDGAARRRAAEIGVRRIDLSLTHTGDHAVAVVVFSGEERT
jgi:holo-[acyl-carrier protein] synthase